VKANSPSSPDRGILKVKLGNTGGRDKGKFMLLSTVRDNDRREFKGRVKSDFQSPNHVDSSSVNGFYLNTTL